jgi:hypothetical protein
MNGSNLRKLEGEIGGTGLRLTVKGCDGLGFFDETTGEVRINPNQPEPMQHVILLHELLHAVDAQLVAMGITEERAPEAFIASMAPNLLYILASLGLYSGVDEDGIMEVMQSAADPEIGR